MQLTQFNYQIILLFTIFLSSRVFCLPSCYYLCLLNVQPKTYPCKFTPQKLHHHHRVSTFKNVSISICNSLYPSSAIRTHRLEIVIPAIIHCSMGYSHFKNKTYLRFKTTYTSDFTYLTYLFYTDLVDRQKFEQHFFPSHFFPFLSSVMCNM